MAAQVYPIVKLLFACDTAVIDPADNKWILKCPWSVVWLPSGASFPFRVNEFWVYAQLADGLGEFDVSVQLRQFRPDDTFRITGWSKTEQAIFRRRQQSLTIDTAFQFRHAPFRESGRYDFCVVANGRLLQGPSAGIMALDGSDKL